MVLETMNDSPEELLFGTTFANSPRGSTTSATWSGAGSSPTACWSEIARLFRMLDQSRSALHTGAQDGARR
jgi:hypothetical protein